LENRGFKRQTNRCRNSLEGPLASACKTPRAEIHGATMPPISTRFLVLTATPIRFTTNSPREVGSFPGYAGGRFVAGNTDRPASFQSTAPTSPSRASALPGPWIPRRSHEAAHRLIVCSCHVGQSLETVDPLLPAPPIPAFQRSRPPSTPDNQCHFRLYKHAAAGYHSRMKMCVLSFSRLRLVHRPNAPRRAFGARP
jgi:hypothetical protein